MVITPGSIQGSEGMYVWLAQDLAERGYVAMTYDVQGQGTSETLPHTTGAPYPFCNLFAAPVDGNMLGCPGVPFQQIANFTTGTTDALDWFLSAANPYGDRLDRTPDAQTVTPGRTTKVAIIGHSLGAQAVSQVQATDPARRGRRGPRQAGRVQRVRRPGRWRGDHRRTSRRCPRWRSSPSTS